MPLSYLTGQISRVFSRSQLFGETYFGTPGHGKQLALTFDDGPNHPFTEELLDLLAEREVKATFFVIGRFVEQRPELVRRMLAEGHAVGNHTHTHPFLPAMGLRHVLEELVQCEMALLTFAGVHRGEQKVVAQKDVHQVEVEEELLTDLRAVRQVTGTRLFRPPWGARTPAIVEAARSCGYDVVMWSAMGFDWRKTTAEVVEAEVARSVGGGDVILLHDGGHKRMGTDRAHTVRATEKLIRRFKAADYEFVTVEKMMGIQRTAAPPTGEAAFLDLGLE